MRSHVEHLITDLCKGGTILPECTRRKGLLGREPYALFLHLKAAGDVHPRVRYVVSGTSAGACTPASLAATALEVSGSLLTDS